jgi:hypothetical protein
MSCPANGALRRLGLAQARINLHTFDVVYQVIILLRTCQPSAPTHRHTTRNSSLRSRHLLPLVWLVRIRLVTLGLCGRNKHLRCSVIWPIQGRVRLCSTARVEEGSSALVPSLGEIALNSPRFPWSETS